MTIAQRIKTLISCYKFSALLIATLTLASTAHATISTWQGPYAGVYLGAAYGNNHLSTSTGTPAASPNPMTDAGTSVTHPSNGILGLQAGYDWVWRQLVYGIALDYGVMPLSSSVHNSGTFPDSTETYSTYTAMSTHWLLTMRGRLGYQPNTASPSLFYLTGGLAATQLKVSNSFNTLLAPALIANGNDIPATEVSNGGNSNSQNQIGWTAGAGIELAAFKNASMNLEYLYLYIPAVRTTTSTTTYDIVFAPPAASQQSWTTVGKFHASLLRLGLNYRFD